MSPRRRPPPRARQIPQHYTPRPHVMGAKASKAEAAVVRDVAAGVDTLPVVGVAASRLPPLPSSARPLLSRARPPRASARAAAENVAVSNAVRRASGATAPRRLDEATHDLSSSVETPAMTTAARSAQPPCATAASRASPLATPCAARAERQRRAASMRRHTTSARAAQASSRRRRRRPRARARRGRRARRRRRERRRRQRCAPRARSNSAVPPQKGDVRPLLERLER